MRFGEFIDLVLLAVGGGQMLDDAQVQRQDVCAYAPTAIGAAFEEWYTAQIAFAKSKNTSPMLDAIAYSVTEIPLSAIKKDPVLGNYFFSLPRHVFASNGTVFVQSLREKEGHLWTQMAIGNSILRTFYVANDSENETSKIIFSKKPTCGMYVKALYKPDCDHEEELLGVPDTVTARALELCVRHFGMQSGRSVELAPDFTAKDRETKRLL